MPQAPAPSTRDVHARARARPRRQFDAGDDAEPPLPCAAAPAAAAPRTWPGS
ncbi:MAG: hypothetical protein MZW92_39905 [Comamonadaceae bacterium]|nr:hypothetical protein [Comamonadaceae bacterium]